MRSGTKLIQKAKNSSVTLNSICMIQMQPYLCICVRYFHPKYFNSMYHHNYQFLQILKVKDLRTVRGSPVAPALR